MAKTWPVVAPFPLTNRLDPAEFVRGVYDDSLTSTRWSIRTSTSSFVRAGSSTPPRRSRRSRTRRGFRGTLRAWTMVARCDGTTTG